MSVFLELPRSRWIGENELAFAIRDGFPVSPGHSLIVPKRVVASWFEATEAEQAALLALLLVATEIWLQIRTDGATVRTVSPHTANERRWLQRRCARYVWSIGMPSPGDPASGPDSRPAMYKRSLRAG